MPINGTIKIPAKAKAVEPQLSVYDTMDADAASEVRDAAARIRQQITGIKTSIIEIGKDLLMVKAKLKDEQGHGKFGAWLEAEFGMSDRTARRYMLAAETLGGISDNLADLPKHIINALAAPSTPDVVKEVVTAEVKAGNTPSVADVQTMVAEAKTIEAATPDMPSAKKAAAVTAAVTAKKDTVQEPVKPAPKKLTAVQKLAAQDEAREKAAALLVKHLPKKHFDVFLAHAEVFDPPLASALKNGGA